MIQCVICEDWFHGRHLGLDVIPESSDYQEMVCESCMKQCDFLWKYRVHSIETRVTVAETSSDIDVTSHSQEQNRSCQSFNDNPEIRAVKAEPASNGLSTCTTPADGTGNSGTPCFNSATSCSNKPEATTQQTTEAVVSSSTTALEKANANDAISTDVKDTASPTNDSLLNPPSVITPADGSSECVSSSTGFSTEITQKSTAARTVFASKELGRECEVTSCAVSVSDMPAVNATNQTLAPKTEAIPATSIASTSQADMSLSSRPSSEQKDVGHSSQRDQQFTSASKGNGQSMKEDLTPDALADEEKGTRLCQLTELSMRDILKSKGAVFWPLGWREKLCSCDECQAMYARLGVAFLQDGGDTVVAYEERGKVKRKGSQYDQGMEALSSMNRVQQVEMLHGYQDMKSALSDFLKGFVEQGKVVTATDIQDFYQGLTRKRQRVGSAGTVQYLCK
ncbi:putative E3 ubiquitin-protein ligase UBR7 [Diadema antillarum]|uniref:putative E3 ubiquitin-protein ligase UBR7 n=1 Tax=Diadema antillarum TaxID=105358 RepID=UPI003A8B02A7